MLDNSTLVQVVHAPWTLRFQERERGEALPWSRVAQPLLSGLAFPDPEAISLGALATVPVGDATAWAVAQALEATGDFSEKQLEGRRSYSFRCDRGFPAVKTSVPFAVAAGWTRGDAWERIEATVWRGPGGQWHSGWVRKLSRPTVATFMESVSARYLAGLLWSVRVTLTITRITIQVEGEPGAERYTVEVTADDDSPGARERLDAVLRPLTGLEVQFMLGR